MAAAAKQPGSALALVNEDALFELIQLTLGDVMRLQFDGSHENAAFDPIVGNIQLFTRDNPASGLAERPLALHLFS